jgi:hypothetical protein
VIIEVIQHYKPMPEECNNKPSATSYKLLANKENDKERLIFKSIKGETVQRPPVWMMRQQVDIYQNLSLCDKYDFTRCLQN